MVTEYETGRIARASNTNREHYKVPRVYILIITTDRCCSAVGRYHHTHTHTETRREGARAHDRGRTHTQTNARTPVAADFYDEYTEGYATRWKRFTGNMTRRRPMVTLRRAETTAGTYCVGAGGPSRARKRAAVCIK